MASSLLRQRLRHVAGQEGPEAGRCRLGSSLGFCRKQKCGARETSRPHELAPPRPGVGNVLEPKAAVSLPWAVTLSHGDPRRSGARDPARRAPRTAQSTQVPAATAHGCGHRPGPPRGIELAKDCRGTSIGARGAACPPAQDPESVRGILWVGVARGHARARADIGAQLCPRLLFLAVANGERAHATNPHVTGTRRFARPPAPAAATNPRVTGTRRFARPPPPQAEQLPDGAPASGPVHRTLFTAAASRWKRKRGVGGGERPETPPLAASWGLLREATGSLELGTGVSPWIPQGGKGQGLSQVAYGGPWHRKPGVRAQRTVVLIGRLFVQSLLCVVPCIRPWGCKSQPDISGCGWATAARAVDTAAVPGRGSREGCPGAQIHLPPKLWRTRKQIICMQPS
ncbi:uncharacterized protein LOC105306615 [Pteropus vampyrus]|uniref:Uncharacterized protein LOC105306615 n=1 Tax=Pteropus vampyrus TaxID=132908 RepID=A0A6P6BXU6_PTEVA|nr:uncharacterized protein LOC105306615 [Pteropus vampyrus]